MLPIPKNRPRELVIDVRALVDASKRAQRVRILVNGQPSESAVLTQSNGNQIHIPLNAQLLSGDYLEVVFELPDAHSPKSAGIGDDDRMLAIGIERARFQ